MQLAHYLNNLACVVAPENLFAQNAIDHAITTGLIELSYDRNTDTNNLAQNYDSIISHYHQHLAALAIHTDAVLAAP